MKVVVLVLQLLFCAVASGQKLSGTKWLLLSIDDLDNGLSKNIAGTVKATLNFDTDTSYSGKFCNNYTGRYKHNGESFIKFSHAISTRMLCMGIDKYEKELFSLLPLANKYRMENDNLFMFTSNHKRITLKRDYH